MEPIASELFGLDPDVLFLNHGSFGACPLPVQEAQARWRARLEREPVRFFVRELEPALDAARAAVAHFVGSPPEELVFVRNATSGCNAVLRSLELEPGDEIVVTSHGYGAVTNAARYVCARAGARVVTAELPFPLADAEAVTEAVRAA
ncbi:MAG: aminotransferase class V-fold PLP-dependent enzyme, partial [Myxococcota bacterium]